LKIYEDVYAYAGKILRIDLSSGEYFTEPTLKYVKEWLGAPGIAIKILYDELKPWVTPYDPSNKLIFGSGALIGTLAPGANKMNVSTLGPMTGGWASSCSDSYVGGQLKYAGFDSIVISGKAHKPIYLFINDNHIEIKDASHLWGKTTWQTLELIRKELNDPGLHIISIGPAGENLVRGACIIQDESRAFGRCGTGAVMGSKNLKALVAKGSGSIKVAKKEEFMKSVREVLKMYKKAKSPDKTYKYGTLYNFHTKQDVCGINYKNFQYLALPEDMVKEMDPRKVIDKFEVSHRSFPACGIHGCGRYLNINKGPYAGLKSECNQWETFSTLQTRLAIKEPTFMVKANALCNQLGIDVDAVGGAIGWAMECYQRGIINDKDTGGIKLNWGDEKVVLKLIEMIAYRQGFGNILSEGSYRASEIIGRNSSYYALHIKGQDLYEVCRGALGFCLGTTTSTRGGGHTTGAVACETSPGLDIEKARVMYGVDNPNKPLEYDGKAEMTFYIEILHRINNCLGICHINTVWWDIDLIGLPQIAILYSAATGWETSVEKLNEMAMRQLNLEKAFNLKFTDFERKDDMPTPRDLYESIPTGKLKGWRMDEKKFNKMLDEYYVIHGWNKKTGYPTRDTLARLGLDYVADDLGKIGKLGKNR